MRPEPPPGIDAVLDSIRSLADLDAARAVVRASGHDGEVRLRSTPIGYIWAPTEGEWTAAADRSQARHRPLEQPARADPPPESDPMDRNFDLRPPFRTCRRSDER
jgi:hypothetical protein